MKYCSTRGGIKNATFEQAVFTGFAPDGGILLPQTIPQVSIDTLKKWSRLSFVDLAKKIIPLFVDEAEIANTVVEGNTYKT